jgi:hypothetical protein
VLIILSPYSEQLFILHFPQILGDPQIGTRRKLLSKIWRYTLEDRALAHPALKNFFADNGTEMTQRIILTHIDLQRRLHGINVPAGSSGLAGIGGSFLFEYVPDVPVAEGVPDVPGIYPMGLTNCDGTHIMHYFTVVVTEEGRIYIDTAYGSDYLQAHPERIELDLAEFNDFILAGISLCDDPDRDALFDTVSTIFTKYFTQNADKFVRYLDEGHTPTRSVIINRERGIELELGFYKNGFRVMYFPTVKNDLLLAAQRDITTILGIPELIARVMS